MICLVLQHYDGDHKEADELARMIADIEPTFRQDVKVRFWTRFDSQQLSLETMRYVAKKFDVSWATSRRKWSGWPDGPNGMAYDLLEDGLTPLRSIGWCDITGFLMLEPDCVPLSKDWLNVLIAEWEQAQKAEAWIMGSWRPSGPECGHINGNCIIRPDIKKKVGLKDAPSGLAWDCYLAPYLKNHWWHTGKIRNDFQCQNAAEVLLKRPEIGVHPPVLVHGYKDRSAIDLAKKWMGL